MNQPTKIYLAIPYSDIDHDLSFRTANKIASELMLAGNIVFSPISHGHAIATENPVPTDFGFWCATCFSFIEWCDEIHIVTLPGWNASVGVSAEITYAISNNKIIKYIEVPGE